MEEGEKGGIRRPVIQHCTLGPRHPSRARQALIQDITHRYRYSKYDLFLEQRK